MEANIEAAGDVVTGNVIASAVSAAAPASSSSSEATYCKNCKSSVSGKFCGMCGQTVHPHRSLLSLGHDILHGVFHVEGRIWHTLPELLFKPGRLTRRYIDGERAKFIAPLPLFLFSVFFLFAVFSFSPSTTAGYENADDAVAKWKEGNAKAVDASNEVVAALRAQMNQPGLAPDRRAELEKKVAHLEASITSMQALATANWASIPQPDAGGTSTRSAKIDFDFAEAKLGHRTAEALRQAQQNPRLLLYKIKTNMYKFSWALIPISIPFLWLLYCWRRDIHIYDHAVFITYSISFVMLFLALLSIVGMLGLSGGWRTAIFGVVAPIHLYKQMRHAYGSSRLGSYLRLIVLSIFISIIVVVFFTGLIVLGAIS